MSRPSAPLLFAAAVAAVAVGWRGVGLADWPDRSYGTLQYESALVARTLWVAADPRDSDREAWLRDTGTRHVTSPPVLPALVAAAYLVTGEEAPWVSRLFTVPLWLAAGGFVGGAAVRLTGSRWAGAAAFAWFALAPFGMLMSRCFQTEPVLACAFAAAVWYLARPMTELTWKRTLAAAAVCGLASFVKPGVLFLPLLAGYAGVVLPRSVPAGIGRKLVHLAMFAAFVVVPGVVYAAALLRQHTGRVMPHLLAERWYYEGVAENVWEAVGPAVVVAVLGIVMAARAGKLLPLALLVGHAGTLAVFTYHAATHDYYQVPLMVVVAVALGWPAAWVERRAAGANRFAVTAVLVTAVAAFLTLTPDPDVGPWRWASEARSELAARAARRRARAEAAADIVAAVGPRARVIELTEGYGYPLQYHGWLRTLKRPSTADQFYLTASGEGRFSTEAYLRHMTASGEWRYFVVTDRAEWDRQPDLRAVLATRGPPLVERPGLLIYDLRPKE